MKITQNRDKKDPHAIPKDKRYEAKSLQLLDNLDVQNLLIKWEK